MAEVLKKYGPAALITGASSGIGEAFAKRLAKEGFDLFLIARREDRLQKLAEELRTEFSRKVFYAVQDLTDRDASVNIQRLIQETPLNLGLFVNNAGFGLNEDFSHSSLTPQLQMIDLNVRAFTELTHRLLPILKSREKSGIILVSSVLSLLPSPKYAVYAATKSFNLYFGEALHHELKADGIDVLTVMPGLTSSEFHLVSGANVDQMPIRPRMPEQVVETALSALGRRSSVADGSKNRFLLFFLRFLSRRWVGAISRKFSKK